MKHKSAILILLVLVFLLAGCSSAPVDTEATSPEAAKTAPQYPTLSQEQAMLEGYVVMVDGDVRYNQKNFTW